MPVAAIATWTPAQRRLHWSIAALVLCAAPLGLYMVALPFRQLLLKFVLYQVHKTIGLTVLLLALWQLALHAVRGRPGWSAGMPPWQRRAARGVHRLLFSLLLLVPVLGYFTAATAPARIPTLFLGVLPVPHLVGTHPAGFAVLRLVHLGAALFLVALAAAHMAMALLHHRRGQDTLKRMWRAS